MREAREAILAATPEQFADVMKSLLSPVDADAMTRELAELLTESQKDGLSGETRAGGMTECRILLAGGLISATSECPSRSGMAVRIGLFPCNTASGWLPTSLVRRLISATATAISP